MSSDVGSQRTTAFDNDCRSTRDFDDNTNDSRPRKKPRKQRPQYSCEECRRLKMKCDRQIPCSNCVRRKRIEFCNGVPADQTSSRPSPVSQSQEGASQPTQLNLEHTQYNSSGAVVEGYPVARPNTSVESREDRAELDRLATVASRLPPQPLGSTLMQNSTALATSSLIGVTQNDAVRFSNAQAIPTTFSHVEEDQDDAHGTLVLSREGRSKYLGPTAGSEWLKDSETQDISESPSIVEAPSPEPPQAPSISQTRKIGIDMNLAVFPFNPSSSRIRTRDLLSSLPPKEEAWTLVESYYRYCAWHHDAAPKQLFQKTFQRVYDLSDGVTLSPAVNPQEIALVYIIMAQGTMYNIEMPHHDTSTEDWLRLSEKALVKGEFLSNNMIPGLQTLHLMAHLHLHLDKKRQGDNAWPLWGLVMRLIQAMGMHRDPSCWGLPSEVVEERRKVFWELNAADVFQAHCFSRPSAINPEHCDTAFPSEPLNLNGEKTYYILRFELSQLSSEILNMAMKVRKPSYQDVMELDRKLANFEINLPFSIRSRAAFLAMPSRYPQPQSAVDASPEPSRRSMTISFQQMNLAFNISETFINLHRPYYAKALYEDIDDRLKSMYAPSYLAVIERCTILISITVDIHARFPAVSTRQWNLWFHVFNSALCLGTLLLRDPGNAMSAFILEQIEASITLFNSLVQHGAATPRYRRNLEWLNKLQIRAKAKVLAATRAQSTNQHISEQTRHASSEEREDGEDVELLGWRTRLIERAGQNRKTVRTIRLAATTPTGSAITTLSNPPANANELGLQDQTHLKDATLGGISVPFVTPDSTNDLLHDFWDPMLLHDVFGQSQNNTMPYMNPGVAWWDDSFSNQNLNQARQRYAE